MGAGVLFAVINLMRGTNKVKNAILQEIQATQNGAYDYHLVELDKNPKEFAEARIKVRISILVGDRVITTDDIVADKLEKYAVQLIETLEHRKNSLVK